MSTKYILGGSGLFLGFLGIVWSFLPEEIIIYFESTPTSISLVFLKILGAFYLGSGFLNWYSKESRIGGIYNRPLALFNTIHFGIAAISIIKYLINTAEVFTILYVLCIIYSIFAFLFIRIIFTTPKEVSQ